MKRSCLILVVLFLLGFGSSSWGQCPEDTVDRGECDTLNVICVDCEQTPGSGPYFVRCPLLVTHDQIDYTDSIGQFVIPLTWTHTNSSAYCSLGSYWNTMSTRWDSSDFERSMFRHIVEGTDTLYHNRMADLAAGGFGRDWDTRILELSTDPPYMHLALVASNEVGSHNQWWWEGDRILLATLTFRMEDTMHVCMDTTFWPPSSHLMFGRLGGLKTYVPRNNLPYCFWVRPPMPDFTVELEPDSLEVQAGDSVNCDVILDSLYGFSSWVALSVSDLPTDASGTFVPDQLVPPDTSNLHINTAVTTPVGTWTALVIASEMAKGIVDTAQLILNVTPPPDFAIEVSPETLEVAQGDEGNYGVILTSLYGFDSPCTLTVSGLPPDASGEFDPNTLIPTGTSALAVSMAETTPTGTYPLTITATELSKAQTQHSTQVVLIVTPWPDPTIMSITDVGNDQGRQVRVKWNRSCLDRVGSPTTITEYGLWRRIGDDKVGSESYFEIPYAGRVYPPGDWDFIKTVPARGESTYSTVCPTLGDSTQAEGMYWSVFFVSAMTSDPLIYFDSDPDSGYSLDNIPPLPIQDLEIEPSSWFTLGWTVPGEYEGEEPISGYDIRYSAVPVGADTQAWWDNAVACSGEGFFNFIVGEKDSLQVAQETWCHPEAYFAIKGLDSRPNASKISNIIRFMCGDVNGDEVIDLGDLLYEISYLYKGGPAPVPMAAGDVNCDGVEDLGDLLYKISYLYKGGPPPCGS